MAAVSLLEGALMIALLGGIYLTYRRLASLMAGIEERQIAPVVARVNGILDDVKGVSGLAMGVAADANSTARGTLAWLLRRFRDSARS